jgi:rare lipoprotein A
MKTGTWLALLVFCAAWMFFLGLLVGRGTVDPKVHVERIETELKNLVDAALREENEQLQAALARLTDPETDDLHEKLKTLKKDDRTLDIPPESVLRQTPPPRETHPEAPKAATPPPPAAEPAAPARPAPTPSAEPSPPPRKGYAVQVASVKHVEAARKMVAALRKKGYAAHLATAVVQQRGVWHRVRVGGFKDRAEAIAVLVQLHRQGYRKAFLLAN